MNDCYAVFVFDTKRTKKIIPIAIGTAEMLLCAAGLCPQNRSPSMLGIGLQFFFGDCLFFNGPQDCSFAGLPYRFNTLYAKIFRELFVFQWPSRGAPRFAMPWPPSSPTLLGTGFPRFFAEALLRTGRIAYHKVKGLAKTIR